MTDTRFFPVPRVLRDRIRVFALDAGCELQLRDTAAGLWCITREGSTLTSDGEWEVEPLPSSRDDAYLARSRFPLGKACELARAHGLLPEAENASAADPVAHLEALIRSGDLGRLPETLDALLAQGLSLHGMAVHVERWRAVNDVLEQDEDFEENALLALDAIHARRTAHPH